MNTFSLPSGPGPAVAIVRRAAAAVLAVATPLAAAATPIGCLLAPLRVADIGVPGAGVVELVSVDRGDAVRKGQALVTLRADSERAALSAAETRASSKAAIDSARAGESLARQKLERARDLRGQNFISEQALEQARAEHAVAQQALQLATDQRAVYLSEMRQARAVLNLRTLVSPINGVVVDRMAQPGERVELRPVLRVADVTALRIEAVVPASHFGTIRAGHKASVQAEVPGLDAREATVTQVDRTIDSASNTFRVRLEMPNPDEQVPAGARCKLEFAGPEVSAAMAGKPAR